MKYIIDKNVYITLKKAADEAVNFFANKSEEELAELNDAIDKAADNQHKMGWVPNSVPLVFIENEKDEDGNPVGLRPMTLGEILKVGPDAVRDDGSAIVAFIRDDWKLPRFSHEEQEGWLAAGILAQKGFPKPYLIHMDKWREYYPPIREISKVENELRDEVAELKDAGYTDEEIAEKEAELEAMEEERKSLNCLKYETYRNRYIRHEGAYPFTIVYPDEDATFEEAFENSILGLRVATFNKWCAEMEEERLSRAVEGTVLNVTDVEEADRRMERWLEEHKTLEAEDTKIAREGKVVIDAVSGELKTIGGMSVEEQLVEEFRVKVNKILREYPTVFGYQVLSDENEEGSLRRGWGAIVQMGFLPENYKEREDIKANRSLWNDFVRNGKGEPATIWTVFTRTAYLVGEGLSLAKYLAMTGASLKEWQRFCRKQRKDADEAVEKAGAFAAWRAAVKATEEAKKAKAEKAKAEEERLASAPF